jgi:hypothetical protein
MQIFRCGTKLRKFDLSHCGVPNHVMKELVDLMEQTPILPNIASITWFDYHDCAAYGELWDYDHLEKLIKTFQHTFPHAEINK